MSLPNVIELKLRSVNQLYNSLDPSPFHEKDLDEDAEEFITSWAMEFPTKEPVALMIYIDEAAADAAAREAVAEAIHHFYKYKAQLKRRELRELLTRGRVSLVIGVAFLAACITASQAAPNLLTKLVGAAEPWTGILSESLLIVGWVALWRPLEIFLYDWWPVRRMARLYDKLSQAKIAVAAAN